MQLQIRYMGDFRVICGLLRNNQLMAADEAGASAITAERLGSNTNDIRVWIGLEGSSQLMPRRHMQPSSLSSEHNTSTHAVPQ